MSASDVMTTVHILYTPMEEASRKPNGKRWCFVCRERRGFEDVTGAYYGPTHQAVGLKWAVLLAWRAALERDHEGVG